MGTISGTRVRAWDSRSSSGSGRSAPGSKPACAERGVAARAALPRSARSATVAWGTLADGGVDLVAAERLDLVAAEGADLVAAEGVEPVVLMRNTPPADGAPHLEGWWRRASRAVDRDGQTRPMIFCFSWANSSSVRTPWSC